jgi:hypothetical protein
MSSKRNKERNIKVILRIAISYLGSDPLHPIPGWPLVVAEYSMRKHESRFRAQVTLRKYTGNP